MGWFKRKEGGTRMGNLLRRMAWQVADKLTLGIGGAIIDEVDGKKDGMINW